MIYGEFFSFIVTQTLVFMLMQTHERGATFLCVRIRIDPDTHGRMYIFLSTKSVPKAQKYES